MPYLIEIVVLTAGAVIMILELCGSRILAPYVGASIVVWSSLIGIILGSLSLGYYLGGKIADRNLGLKSLSATLFLSSLSILLLILFKQPIFYLVQSIFNSLINQTIMATILLFVLPNTLLGMVSPVAAKIRLNSIKSAGSTVGNLYALSTLGSILGTFLAGFYLIEHFPVTQILLGLATVLFGLSVIVFSQSHFLKTSIFILLAALSLSIDQSFNPIDIKVFDSQYNHIQVQEIKDEKTQKMIRVLNVNNEPDSAMFLDSNELVFDYTKAYRLAKLLNPEGKNVLMIGGGAYSVPKDLLANSANIKIDVVEIDPELTNLARQYFNLKDDPKLTIYHEDGRTFLNKNSDKKYDIVLIDAFKGYTIPFHLTTLETIQQINNMLTDNGVVMVNVISAINGLRGEFLRAEYKTYQQVFPQVAIMPITDPENGDINQNIMLISTKNNQVSIPGVWSKKIILDMPILTDDFAPVEQYAIKNL